MIDEYLNKKQFEAFSLFFDDSTSTIGYGGAAGGGKTWLGCYILIVVCESLVGSKWFIGRDSLKDTRESVLFTFKKVTKSLGFQHWTYKDNHIYFENGSEIEFIDLSFYPEKDPMYERFGSKEYTGGWIEEAGNVNYMAFEVLKTRVGRWFNFEFGLIGKVLVTFNPKKNWLHSTFYTPYKNKKESTDTKFIPALFSDNPKLTEDYIKKLKNIKDKATRERLLFGNFDYDDSPTALVNYDVIHSIWSNHHVHSRPNKKYIVADIARFGSNDAIIAVFDDFKVIDYVKLDYSSTVLLQQVIVAKRHQYGIPAYHCLADEDGVGGGVVDNCGILGYHGGASALNKRYFHLKDECGYKLSELLHLICFECDVPEMEKQRIENELGQLRTWEIDKDGKLRIPPKVQMVENLGTSPDWLDVLMMRMDFELRSGAAEGMSEALKKALQVL